MKEELVSKKRKVYPLSRKEREEICDFIVKQLRKEYIRPSKTSQIALVFFCMEKRWEKEDGSGL